MPHLVTPGPDDGQSTTAIDAGSNGGVEERAQGIPTASSFSPNTSCLMKHLLPWVQFQPGCRLKSTDGCRLWFLELALLARDIAIPSSTQKGSDKVDVQIHVVAYTLLETAAKRHKSIDKASKTVFLSNDLAANYHYNRVALMQLLEGSYNEYSCLISRSSR